MSRGLRCAYITWVTIRNPTLYLSQAPPSTGLYGYRGQSPRYTRSAVPREYCSNPLFQTGFLSSSRCASLTSPSANAKERRTKRLRLAGHTLTRLARVGVP